MKTHTTQWQPSASLDTLHARADILKKIREFFQTRNVLEVETPVFCSTTVTDPYIESIPAIYCAHPQSLGQTFYLQTSPEYAMKRLLAAGSGAIYQITKSFRQGEVGQYHNPEFSMLEWYQPHYSAEDLMLEVDALLQNILGTPAAESNTYAEIFQKYLAINPHTATLQALRECAAQQALYFENASDDKDTWLHFLFSHCIEPKLGQGKPCFIYEFPASQAALAQLHPENPTLALRFEVYFRGIELANGFKELCDSEEQRLRFEKNNQIRQALGMAELLLDERFLSALQAGLPDCAGVALGLDRLMMLSLNKKSIQEVISFDHHRS